MRPVPPKRLGSMKSSDPELVRALDALGSTRVDAARVARVGQKLGPVLEAPLPAAQAASGVSGLLGKSVLVKLLAATGAVVVAISWPSAEPTAPEPTAQVGEIEAPATTQGAMEPAPASLPVQAAPAPSSPATVLEPPAKQAEASTAPAGPPGRSEHVVSPPRRPVRAAKPRATPTRASAVTVTPAVAASSASEPWPSSVGTAAEPIRAPQPARTAEVEAPAPRLPSEADLLLSARRQLRRDPRATLDLLAQHERRFAHGMLSPEREVLAIDALRALGNDDAARARLARFRENYPDSLHLVGTR